MYTGNTRFHTELHMKRSGTYMYIFFLLQLYYFQEGRLFLVFFCLWIVMVSGRMTAKFELVLLDIMILPWKWSSLGGAESLSVKLSVLFTWSWDFWMLKSKPSPGHLWSYKLPAQWSLAYVKWLSSNLQACKNEDLLITCICLLCWSTVVFFSGFKRNWWSWGSFATEIFPSPFGTSLGPTVWRDNIWRNRRLNSLHVSWWEGHTLWDTPWHTGHSIHEHI